VKVGVSLNDAYMSLKAFVEEINKEECHVRALHPISDEAASAELV
jgi:hypothetical protein